MLGLNANKIKRNQFEKIMLIKVKCQYIMFILIVGKGLLGNLSVKEAEYTFSLYTEDFDEFKVTAKS